MRLFGPGPLPQATRGRLGDFVGIPLDGAFLEYSPAGGPAKPEYRGLHGGLSPEEMHVPLILA